MNILCEEFRVQTIKLILRNLTLITILVNRNLCCNLHTIGKHGNYEHTQSKNERRVQVIKVRKTARTRNRYNRVPHLSQDTKLESNKITINITNNSQEVSPFPSGDHKAAMNRRESMMDTRHK